MGEKQSIINQLNDSEPRWFAVYVNYKREKLVQKLLSKKKIEVFLPLNKVVRRYERKVKNLELPLFSCYLFVKIVKSQYIQVLETENVLKFIRFNKDLLAIPEGEIDIVKRVIGESKNVEVVGKEYLIGTRVEVVGGSMTGLKGILIDQKGKNKFLIELNTIGYALQMEIDSKYLMRSI